MSELLVSAIKIMAKVGYESLLAHGNFNLPTIQMI